MTTWGDQHLVPKAPWNCSVVYVWVPLPSRGLLGTQPHSPAPPPHCCPNPGLWVSSWEPDSKAASFPPGQAGLPLARQAGKGREGSALGGTDSLVFGMWTGGPEEASHSGRA